MQGGGCLALASLHAACAAPWLTIRPDRSPPRLPLRPQVLKGSGTGEVVSYAEARKLVAAPKPAEKKVRKV